MNLLSRGLPVAVCAAALLASVAATSAQALTPPLPVEHTARIEGANRTLLPETPVTVPGGNAAIGGDVSGDCRWSTPAGPLHIATAGNWDRSNFVKTILGETHDTSATSWFVWVNGTYGNGICFTDLAPNSEVVFTAGAFDANFNPVDLPMTVRDVPARIAPGQPFTVRVDQIQPDRAPEGYYLGGTGRPVPAQGATVTAGGASATVGADGRATLAVGASGPVTVQATRGAAASRSKPVATCATNGADGACGTAGPVRPATPGTAAPATVRDTLAPKATIASLGKTRRIRASRAPKLLKGTVVDPSGILMVKLRLTRTSGGKCSAWSARRERFVRRPKCGAKHGWWFKVGEESSWEYRLPSRLPKGRYVLDVKGIDRNYNRDEERRRGENRVVFRVR